MPIPVILMWVGKAVLFGVGVVLAVRHELTPEVAGLLGAGLVTLGVKNGAASLAAAVQGGKDGS